MYYFLCAILRDKAPHLISILKVIKTVSGYIADIKYTI